MACIENIKKMDLPHISVIVLNWNGWKDTLECLESVFQVDYENFSLILVDNGSSDDSLQKFREYCQGEIEVQSSFITYTSQNKPRQLIELEENVLVNSNGIHLPEIQNNAVILIKCKENYGYAKGNNIGIRTALKLFNPGYILVLNNDIIVNERNMFSLLVDGASQEKSIGVVSPILRSRNGEIQRACTRNFPTFFDYLFVYSFLGQRLFRNNRYWNNHFNAGYAFDKPRQVDVLGGSCMLFKSESLAKVNLFDENTFLYWEEFILGKKLQSAGIQSYILPNTSVIHKGEITINTLNLKSWARYWSIQSELYYIDQYTRTPLLQRSLILVVLLVEALMAGGAAVFSRKVNPFNLSCEKKSIKFLLRSFFP